MGDEAGGGLAVRALSFHADYRCRNTGICCSSGWEIAVEEGVELHLTTELRDRQDRPVQLNRGSVIQPLFA